MEELKRKEEEQWAAVPAGGLQRAADRPQTERMESAAESHPAGEGQPVAVTAGAVRQSIDGMEAPSVGTVLADDAHAVEAGESDGEPLRRTDRLPATRLARAVSTVLHPLLVPLYVMLLVLYGPTQLAVYPPSVKFYLVWVTLLYTTVIPLLAVGLLRSLGYVSSIVIDRRRERILPLLIGILCYLLCAATIARIPSAMIIRKFMMAGACCELFCLAVTLYWKVSLHMAAQGAVAAFLVLLTFGNAGNLTVALAVATLAAGLLASSRLWLGCHTLRQVAGGYVGGFLVALFAVLVL